MTRDTDLPVELSSAEAVERSEDQDAPSAEGGAVRQGIAPRLVALTALATLAVGTVVFARSVYFAMTDAWIAPIMLSPDSDAVVAVNVKLNEHEVERAKLRSDIARIDMDVTGIDAAIAELEAIEHDARDSLRSTSSSMTTSQVTTSNDRIAAIEEQLRVIRLQSVREAGVGQERRTRLRLDLVKLDSEKRALLSQRAIAAESLVRMGELLQQLRSRPAYRAVQARSDIAFVPYSQLDGAKAGSPVYSCKWVLFRCTVVGRVAEVLPGEVLAQDPWHGHERGQYAILELRDREAAKEKVLRARLTP